MERTPTPEDWQCLAIWAQEAKAHLNTCAYLLEELEDGQVTAEWIRDLVAQCPLPWAAPAKNHSRVQTSESSVFWPSAA